MPEIDPAQIQVTTADGNIHLALGETSSKLNADEALELSRKLTEATLTIDQADSDEPSEQVRLPMQLLILQAEREPEAAAAEEEDAPNKAVVYCWIKGQTRMNAIHIAVGSINETDWIVTDLKEQQAVTREDFADTEFEHYFDQALTDEEVFLYLVGDEDEEEDEVN